MKDLKLSIPQEKLTTTADGETQAGHIKYCKYCNIELNETIAAKKDKNSWRKECKPCRSKQVVKYQKQNSEARNKYAKARNRRLGIVKQYPCVTCGNFCYKKYSLAFCSDKCRFMHYVNKTDSCWFWIGAKTYQGYGKLSYKKYKTFPAHRLSYILFNGEIEHGLLICHKCDVPSCVNPEHLWLGTPQDNTIDMYNKKRGRSNLSIKDVLQIREMVALGAKQKKIAEMFHLTSGAVSSIVSKRTWKHI